MNGRYTMYLDSEGKASPDAVLKLENIKKMLTRDGISYTVVIHPNAVTVEANGTAKPRKKTRAKVAIIPAPLTVAAIEKNLKAAMFQALEGPEADRYSQAGCGRQGYWFRMSTWEMDRRRNLRKRGHRISQAIARGETVVRNGDYGVAWSVQQLIRESKQKPEPASMPRDRQSRLAAFREVCHWREMLRLRMARESKAA